MKRRILFVALISAVVALSACGDDDVNVRGANDETLATANKADFSDAIGINGSLMDGFYTPRRVDLRGLIVTDANGEEKKGIEISLSTGGEEFSPEVRFTDHMTAQEKKIYNDYVRYYGDTSCVTPHYHGSDDWGCMFPVKNISISVDKDFDATHSAGADVSDLFVFFTSDRYFEYIEAGYKEYGMLTTNRYYQINEVSGFKLLDRLSYLCLMSKPSESGDYTFTVRIDFDKDPVSGKDCVVDPVSITLSL